jgi:DNA-binding beta-propeller fold protein YncE
VRYGFNGAVQDTFLIAGEVDGLKVNPVTGVVWALQNQDGNSTLSLIDPTTNTASSPCLTGRRTSMGRPAPAAMTTSRSSMAMSISATRIR